MGRMGVWGENVSSRVEWVFEASMVYLRGLNVCLAVECACLGDKVCSGVECI